jgi:hypothetical protein
VYHIRADSPTLDFRDLGRLARGHAPIGKKSLKSHARTFPLP